MVLGDTNLISDEIRFVSQDLDVNSSRGSRVSSQISAKSRNPGAYSGEVTPVPIPNTAVKLARADGSPRASVCESRSAPGFLLFLYLGGGRRPALAKGRVAQVIAT